MVQKIKSVNAARLLEISGRKFSGKSYNASELKNDPTLEIDYIIAPPQMAHYMEWSTRIYEIYLKYVVPEDIHVYSIDEVFMDITPYLRSSGQRRGTYCQTG